VWRPRATRGRQPHGPSSQPVTICEAPRCCCIAARTQRNARTQDEDTALHAAAGAGRTAAVTALVRLGARVDTEGSVRGHRARHRLTSRASLAGRLFHALSNHATDTAAELLLLGAGTRVKMTTVGVSAARCQATVCIQEDDGTLVLQLEHGNNFMGCDEDMTLRVQRALVQHSHAGRGSHATPADPAACGDGHRCVGASSPDACSGARFL
jgi:hypothetical protein